MIFFTILGVITFILISIVALLCFYWYWLSKQRWYRDFLDFFGVPYLVWFKLPKMTYNEVVRAKELTEKKFMDRPHAKWAIKKYNQRLDKISK